MKDLKRKLSNLYKAFLSEIRKPIWLAVFSIFIFAFLVRFISIYPSNIVFDFDQVEDLFYTKKIVSDKDLIIIGRAIYGDPNLHHGVFFFYYNIFPFILFKWNPVLIALWNSVFNAAVSIIVFLFAKSIFRKTLPAILAAFIVAVSYEFVQFSGWISSITIALFTVPIYFFGLWSYYRKKNWGLILASIFLGLSIQSDLLFLYLIPIFAIFWLVFKPRFPKTKIIVLSALSFIISVFTMILTEIKLNFAGVKALVHFDQIFDDAKMGYIDRLTLFFKEFWLTFSYNLFPHRQDLGIFIGLAVIIIAIFFSVSKTVSRQTKFGILFLLIYLFSPIIMLLLGFHGQPWFLIGIPPAIALLSGYALSKLKYLVLILPLLGLMGWSNVSTIIKNRQQGPVLLKPEVSSLLSSQLAVVDYTYEQSFGKPFAINTVTYPLYHNAIWDYHYNWYGEDKYGYLPGWLGGDQLYPYDILPKPEGSEKYFYLIIDQTYRIPEVYRLIAKDWADKEGGLVEEKVIGGFTIQKRKR
jgi:4-amino-4-deoxy-L-arabinose transferase-like glycosyltransferase